jgi:Mg-chelatase subunit ChlD
MRSSVLLVSLSIAASVGCLGVARAGDAASAPIHSSLEEQMAVHRVVWPVFVEPRDPVDTDHCLGLPPDRVRVTEDRTAVEVTSLDRERRPTLHALLIDTSESMSERNSLHLAREAAKRYVAQLQSHDSIAVYSFDDVLVQRAPVTRMADADARRKVQAAIDDIAASGGLTHLRDALNQLVLHAESYPERKVIIVLTDGVDTMSRLSPARVLGTAMSTPRQNVTIYTVGIGITPYAGGFVRQLAELTGGKYFGIREPDQIGATFQEVGARLARESYLGWIPRPFGQGRKDPADEVYTFREVHIKSLDRRCKIDNPREYRFASNAPTKAPDFVLDVDQPALPATRLLPIGRHWQVEGETPFELTAERDSMHGRFVDVVREWGVIPGESFPIRPSSLSDDEVFQVRPFRVVVPPLAELLGGGLSGPEDVLLYWLRNDIEPVDPTSGSRGEYLVHGTTLLELRESLAESLYAFYPSYRRWAQERLVEPVERTIRYRFPDQDDETVRRLLTARLSQPSTREIGMSLATWLGDISAQELVSRLERRAINALLARAASWSRADCRLAVLIEENWDALRRWFPEDEQVRILAPLVPVYDEDRGEIGFYRVILPRADSEGTLASVPRRPFALQFVERLLAAGAAGDLLDSGEWQVSEVSYRTVTTPAAEPAPPHVVHRTELEFVRNRGSRDELGTLVLVRRPTTTEGPILCVEGPTGLAGIDEAVAALHLSACDPRSQPVSVRSAVEDRQLVVAPG